MTATDSPDSGYVEGGEHFLRMRVYYEDTDAGGIVYHSKYLNFAERARTEMLRLAGISQREVLAREGLAFAVRDLSINYLRPARLDDEIVVRSRVVEHGAASLTLVQHILRVGPEGAAEEDLSHLRVRVACVRSNGRPSRIPSEVRAAFENFRTEAEN